MPDNAPITASENNNEGDEDSPDIAEEQQRARPLKPFGYQ